MKILVTGSTGMVGSCLVTALLKEGFEVVGVSRSKGTNAGATNLCVDLLDRKKIKEIVEEYQVDKIVHLAALAHEVEGKKLEYADYYKANVTCAKNVFYAAGDRPVLHISTVDVYGFTKGVVGPEAPLHPVSDYGKTKALAEQACKKLCIQYSIFRLSPVYTKSIKRDIQKRYYLKYPNLAYRVGKGEKYEVVDVDYAVQRMVDWCKGTPDQKIHVIKDKKLLNSARCIKEEQKEGRAKHVIYVPRFLVQAGVAGLKFLTGENKYTYLLNKAVNPLRTSEDFEK